MTGAGSAAEALRVLAAERPDVLLTDLHMPEEDGFHLIRQVRALPRRKNASRPGHGLAAARIARQCCALDSSSVLPNR